MNEPDDRSIRLSGATSRDGPIVLTRLVAHGGWTLADHWGDTATQSALRERPWDWVVLNEQSTFGETYLVDGKNRVHTWSAFAAAAARFSSEAKQIGARLAIVSHWSREKAPTRDDEALRFAFDSVARSLGAVLIPAGTAWHSPEVADRRISLYAADGSHPSAAGSYLLASLLYAFLTEAHFAVRTGLNIRVVPAGEVEWISAAGDYAELHTRSGIHLMRETMNSLEDRLDPSRFARIHRSRIVNLAHILELRGIENREYVVTLRNGSRHRSSRTYADRLENWLRSGNHER